MDLFSRPGYFLIEELQKLDISKMTPLDAMNCLSELQEKANLSVSDQVRIEPDLPIQQSV